MRLETKRLILRAWRDEDRAPFAAINAAPEVRRYYYPDILDRAQTDAMIDACAAELAARGFGFLAAERKSDDVLIGGIGLSAPGPEVPGNHGIEIGWILGSQHWGQGYAFEAATAILGFAWETLGAAEVVGYTTETNLRSRRLMEKLGMMRDPAADFEDTTVPVGHWQRPHVLYRIANPR